MSFLSCVPWLRADGAADCQAAGRAFESLQARQISLANHMLLDLCLRAATRDDRIPGDGPAKFLEFIGEFGRAPALRYGWTDHGGLVSIFRFHPHVAVKIPTSERKNIAAPISAGDFCNRMMIGE